MGINMSAMGAEGAAKASLQWGAQATQLQALGALAQGVGGYTRNSFAAQVAKNNAEIARANGTAALEAGTYEAAQTKLRYGLIAGEQKAAQAANGVDVGIGSAVAVRESTERVGAMDAAMQLYNAQRTAYGANVEAASQESQAKLDKMAARGSLLNGLFSAGSSVLSGAASVAGQKARYGLDFPAPAGAPPPKFAPGG